MNDILAKEDITLEQIEDKCSECDELKAEFWLQIDLGFEITPLGDGRYCGPCGEQMLDRVRELLPERVESE